MGLSGSERCAFSGVLAAVFLSLTLSACTVSSDYQQPELKLPATWQAALPHDGRVDTLVDWWRQFDDPTLIVLIEAAQAENPSLALATARIEEARAQSTIIHANLWPAVDAKASINRTREQRNYSTQSMAGLDAFWEVDLFGGARRASESALEHVEAREIGWHDARISLAAEVAGTYINFRACQQLVAAHQKLADSRAETARLTKVAADAGFMALADDDLTTADAAYAASHKIGQSAECDVMVKSLVALTGLEESDVRSRLEDAPARFPAPAPFSVTALPVSLLSQRPDLIVAERELAAAHADIGVAEAARYPRLSLLGSIFPSTLRMQGSDFHSTLWSFGPSLTLPVLDGGRHAANVRAAQARYDQALAHYKQSVTHAVKEVEQSLVLLDSAARREADVRTAMEKSRTYFESVQTHWNAGGASLLNLESARRLAIAAEMDLIVLQRDRVQCWNALYKALGGGWRQAETASKP